MKIVLPLSELELDYSESNGFFLFIQKKKKELQVNQLDFGLGTEFLCFADGFQQI